MTYRQGTDREARARPRVPKVACKNPSVESVPLSATLPRIWVVRAGHQGKYGELFRSQSIVALSIEFNHPASRATAAALVAAGYSPGNAPSLAAVLRRFAVDLKVAESVISPISGQQRYLVGMVTSDYRFVINGDEPGLQHLRDVSWQAELQASEFPIQLRRSLGSPMVFYLPAAQRDLTSFLHEQGLLTAHVEN